MGVNGGYDASEFDAIFLRNGKQIPCGLACTQKEVLKEWLVIDDKKVFERTGTELSLSTREVWCYLTSP